MYRYVKAISSILVFVGLGLYLYTKNTSKSSFLYRCAIIAPAEHPAMNEIINGFVQTVKSKNAKAEFVIFNGQGNKTLLHSQVEKVVNDNFDIVMTIGLVASQLTAELLKKRNVIHLKHIFTAVDEPLQKGLINSLEKPNGQTTGVMSASNNFLNQQIGFIKKIKPALKHILLVYDPAHPTNIKDKNELAKICSDKKIVFSDIAIMQTNELAQKLPVFLDKIDTILVLKDHLIVAGIDLLIKLCSTNGITLYCSDLNSGQKGAALAFGVYEYDYGRHAGLMAIDILINKKKISEIPVYDLKEHYLLINKNTSTKQGLSLSNDQLTEYKKDGVIVYE